MYMISPKNLFRNLKMPGQTLEWFRQEMKLPTDFLEIYSNRDKGESFNVIWGDKKKSTEVNKYLKAGIKAVREYTPQLWLHYTLKHQMYGNTKRS